MKPRDSWLVAAHVASVCLLVGNFRAPAEPRSPLPPWPEASSGKYTWDSPYWGATLPSSALHEDLATHLESWSGYALLRDSLTTAAPVAIPGLRPDGRVQVAPAYGAVRFWISPHWANAEQGGKGPGHYARLLEWVSWGGTVPETRWSLYVTEDGSTIYFSGLGVGGATDFLKAPIAFQAGEWWAVTVCYSATNSELWLNDELVATGAGVTPPAPWEAQSLGLVVGSDMFGSPDSSAERQFEELKLFDYWPDAQQQAFFLKGTWRHVLLGTVGTSEEEEARQALVEQLYPRQQSEAEEPLEYALVDASACLKANLRFLLRSATVSHPFSYDGSPYQDGTGTLTP